MKHSGFLPASVGATLTLPFLCGDHQSEHVRTRTGELDVSTLEMGLPYGKIAAAKTD